MLLSINFIYSQTNICVSTKLIYTSDIFPNDKFDACHASTIVELNNGLLMAAWFAGSYEGANDVGIWISFFKVNIWTQPILIAVGRDSIGQQLPCWNPVLFKTSNDEIILFYKVGKNPREWWGLAIKSSDYGKSWTQPIKLPNGFLGPIKNKPIQLSNGNILCPSSVEKNDGDWSVHLEITNENLSSWKKIFIQKDTSIGVIQPTILVHSNGELQMLCRSRQDFIYQSLSTDQGLSWSELTKSSLPNPNSGIDAVTVNDSSYILVYNPLFHGSKWYEGRNILNAAISKDGINWTDIYQLENEKDGEFSYPSIIQSSDMNIHITYTVKRKTIKHVVLQIK
jgi:alpha-L-fucosidase